MDARIYQLDAMRSRRNSRTFMAPFYRTPTVSDGLALCQAAMSFSAQYVAVMASFHHRLWSAVWSPYLK